MITKSKPLRRCRLLAFGALLLGTSAIATAQETAQQAQSPSMALKKRLEAADDAMRQGVEDLLMARRNAERLQAYNDELAATVKNQEAFIARREQALARISTTRESVPVLMRNLVERLQESVENDLPFLREERLARAKDLDSLLSDAQMSLADKLDRVLSAWRTELDYGRDMDAWRGALAGAEDRQVEYLRLGRVGWYYLSPDGKRGGVWKAAAGQWQPLNEHQLAEARKGIRIAREQRAPELLELPLSVDVQSGEET